MATTPVALIYKYIYTPALAVGPHATAPHTGSRLCDPAFAYAKAGSNGLPSLGQSGRIIPPSPAYMFPPNSTLA